MLIDRTAGGRLKVKPHVEWRDNAVELIRTFARNRTRKFAAIHLMLFAQREWFPEPPDLRAWGPALVQAQYDGIIKKVGTISAPGYRRGAKVTLWQAA
jgi:hypothetical protein